MEQWQLKKFKVWFDDYVAQFYGDDEYINANLKLKEEHSRRTCGEILYLADELDLDAGQKRLAEAMALFHDIGRFGQFVKYGTYNDTRSVDHSGLGLEVLAETNVLGRLAAREREIIEKAIECHGMMEVPGWLDGDCVFFSKLLRDADKLDIFYVVTDYYAQYKADPEGFDLEVEFADEPWYSPEVVEATLKGERIDYTTLQTWNDAKILQLGWVFDVNFPATLKRIRDRRYLETILEFLPDDEDIHKIRQKVLTYVDDRINKDA